MARRTTWATGTAVMPAAARKKRIAYDGELPAVRARILEDTSALAIHDPDLVKAFIRSRQEREIDKYDEVWEGVYVVPPLARNPHQSLGTALSSIFFQIIELEGKGTVHAGANVSDRRENWEHNFRCPDVVVVLKDGHAVDCSTHWFGGPDFLVEVLSPNDVSGKKIPFYAHIHVRELMIIHPDTRQMQLYRHDGQTLVLTEPTDFQGSKWLVSRVIPVAFRRKMVKRAARTELRRTDGKSVSWTI